MDKFNLYSLLGLIMFKDIEPPNKDDSKSPEVLAAEKKMKTIRTCMFVLLPMMMYGSLLIELIPSALSPILIVHYDYDPSDIGLIYMCIYLPAIPLLFFSANLIKKIGYKWILVVTCWG